MNLCMSRPLHMYGSVTNITPHNGTLRLFIYQFIFIPRVLFNVSNHEFLISDSYARDEYPLLLQCKIKFL